MDSYRFPAASIPGFYACVDQTTGARVPGVFVTRANRGLGFLFTATAEGWSIHAHTVSELAFKIAEQLDPASAPRKAAIARECAKPVPYGC